MLVKTPLFEGASLEIYRPDIDYFIDKIKNCEYISQIRFQIEYWNMIRSAMRIMGYPGKEMPKVKVDNKFLDKLSHSMMRAFENDYHVGRGRPWKFSQEVFRGHLSAITSPKPEGFILAVADRGVYYDDGVPETGHAWQSDLIKTLIPNGEVPFLSTVWRKWSQSGEIQKFIDVIKDKAVVVVGPYYYKDLAEKIGLTNHRYIEIHYKEACLHVKKTKQRMIVAYNEMLRENDDVVFLMSGGSAGAWLAYELHTRFEKAHILELGRAMDVFFCYDYDIRSKVPNWVFGQWMKNNPPLWLKESQG